MSSLSFLSHIKPLPFSPGYCSDSSPVRVLRSQIHHCTIALLPKLGSLAPLSWSSSGLAAWRLKSSHSAQCNWKGNQSCCWNSLKTATKGMQGWEAKDCFFLLFSCFLKMTRNTRLSKRAEAVDPSSDSARKTNKPGIVFHVHARAPGRTEPLLREWFYGISLSK